jgi:hypothetical protein|tara:strand:- start:1392 stop:1568 length:177 start_codon:yes stop_codon:yes gene_type:complete
MFTYIAFYKGKEITVNALRSFDAQEQAARIFKAKKSYEVTVMLAAKGDEPVIHHPATI